MKELISDSMSTHFNGETSSFRSPLELAKKLFKFELILQQYMTSCVPLSETIYKEKKLHEQHLKL